MGSTDLQGPGQVRMMNWDLGHPTIRRHGSGEIRAEAHQHQVSNSKGVTSRARGATRPSFGISSSLLGREGAGKTGYRLIPAVRVQQKSTRQNHRISP